MTFVLLFGPFALLYWSPPWHWERRTSGAAGRGIVFESFFLIGFVREENGIARVTGCYFYKALLKFCAFLYITAISLLLGDVTDYYAALITFGVFGFFVFGVFERDEENEMNERVKTFLALRDE